MTKLIAVASAKGGVGKTTILLNLGTALTLFGRNTLIVDGNVATPALAIHLGVGHLFPTLSEVLSGEIPLSEAIFQHQTGLKTITANLQTKPQKLTWGEILLDLKQRADLVLMDTPTQLEEEIRKNVDAAILVTTPDLPAVAGTLKTAQQFRKSKIPIIGVIINRVNNDHAEMHQQDIKQMLEVPLLGSIPEDDNVRRSLKIGHPVVHAYPGAPASVRFKQIAAQVLGQKYETPLKKKHELWYKWFT